MFEDPNYERRDYVPLMAYAQSKTANILFALALDERGKAEGVRAFSLHPGSIVGTGLSKHIAPEMLRAAGHPATIPTYARNYARSGPESAQKGPPPANDQKKNPSISR